MMQLGNLSGVARTRKVQEIDTKLRAEQAKLEEAAHALFLQATASLCLLVKASLRLQTFQRKETQTPGSSGQCWQNILTMQWPFHSARS